MVNKRNQKMFSFENVVFQKQISFV